jgi:hypothetical protein
VADALDRRVVVALEPDDAAVVDGAEGAVFAAAALGLAVGHGRSSSL